MTRGAAAAALVASLVLAPGLARAEEPEQRAAAQVLFDRARELVKAEDYAEACPKFAESKRLDPGIGTSLWLADCYEHLGRTASAWVEFKEAAAAAALRGDPREKVAKNRAAALEPRLARLAIVVPKEAAPSGLVVKRDGLSIGAAEWGLRVPVDPGVHTVAAAAPRSRPWTVSVSVPQAAENLTVTVPRLEPRGDEDEPSTDPSSPAAAPATSRASGARTLAIVLGAAGVGGLGVGGTFGLVAKSTYDRSNEDGHCLPDNRCDPTGRDRRHAAETQALVSTVAIGAGAAALAGGLVLWLTAPKHARGAARAAVVPAFAAGAAGLVVHGAL